MAALSPYTSQYSSSPSSSSQAAEALLSRARHLSSNAYERTRASVVVPIAFAEGEDISVSSPTANTPTSPCLSPSSASLSSASLHQLHRSSFNDLVRDHGRKRSSQQRLSSSSSNSTTAATKAASSSPLSTESSESSSSSMLPTAGREANPQQSDLTQPSDPQSPSSLTHDNNNENNGWGAHTPRPPTTVNTAGTGQQQQQQQQQHQQVRHKHKQSPMTRHSLTIITRPPAPTLESIRENGRQDNDRPHSAASTHSNASSDWHRKHRSDNGASIDSGKLVLEVLDALRDRGSNNSRDRPDPSPRPAIQSPGQQAPLISAQDRQQQIQPQQHPKAGLVPTGSSPFSSLSSSPFTANRPAQMDAPVTAAQGPQGPEKVIMHRSRAESMPVPAASACVSPPSPSPLRVSTQENRTSAIAPSAPCSISSASVTATLPPSGRASSSPSPPLSKPVSDPARRGSRGGESVRSQDSSSADTSLAATLSLPESPSTQTSAVASKNSKRSSRFFGKLMPKFLQTSSVGPATSNVSSPKSAYPASPSSLSSVTATGSVSSGTTDTAPSTTATRSARSASFAGGASSPMVAAPSKKAQQTLPTLSELKDTLNLPTLPALPTSVLEAEEDWLRSVGEPYTPRPGSGSGSVSTNATALPATAWFTSVAVPSSDAPPDLLTLPKPAQGRPASIYKVEIVEEEVVVRHHRDLKQEYYDHSDLKQEFDDRDFKQEYHEQDRDEDDHHSPYIIDETCDDDFFLNSVLRKKHYTGPGRPQEVPMFTTAGFSSGSATGSGSGFARTPSLSMSFSSSSRSSSTAPSPTMPMFTQSQMQGVIIDEKRTRLSDAVKEWRRSASNGTPGSLNSATPYSGPLTWQ